MKKLSALLLTLLLTLSLTVPCFAAPPCGEPSANGYGIEVCDYGEEVPPPPKDNNWIPFSF